MKTIGDLLLSNFNSTTTSQRNFVRDSATMSKRPRKSMHEETCIHNIYEFVYYIQKIKDPALISIDDQSLDKLEVILSQMDFLIKNSTDIGKIMEKFCKEALVQIFVHILEHCFDFIISVFKVLYNAELTKKEKQRVLNKGATVYMFLLTFVQLVWCLTNFSTKFRIIFHTLYGSQSLFLYITNKTFIDFVLLKNNIFRREDMEDDENDQFMLMNAILGSLHNISKSIMFEDELNPTKNLISFAHEIRKEKGHLMQIYMILANIMTDKEIDELKDTVIIVNKLVEIIGECAKLIAEQKTKLRRSKIEMNDGIVEYVCSVADQNGVKWDLTELIRALYRIAVNDRIKFYIYNDCNTKEYIVLIVLYGNLIEKEYAIRLLYQLSFDKNVAKLIKSDKKLIESVNNLISSASNDQEIAKNYPKLLEYCKGLKWTIETKLSQDENARRNSLVNLVNQKMLQPESGEPSSESETPKQHQIMISYNSQNREMCLNIKSQLEKLGFKIWIDVENIHGSSLEAMASAIENSDCILICMTEKYKLSVNCRAEAEYTFNIRKSYIPLIMQKNYKPDGWLGLILGAKIFIDFTKYTFDVSMEKLRKEIMQEPSFKQSQSKNWNVLAQGVKTNSITKYMSQVSSEATPPTTANVTLLKATITSSSDTVLAKEWSKEKVQEWLSKQDLNPGILGLVKDFNGEMLYELNAIRNTASEYFYNSISQQNTIELNEVVRFSNVLRKLGS